MRRNGFRFRTKADGSTGVSSEQWIKAQLEKQKPAAVRIAEHSLLFIATWRDEWEPFRKEFIEEIVRQTAVNLGGVFENTFAIEEAVRIVQEKVDIAFRYCANKQLCFAFML